MKILLQHTGSQLFYKGTGAWVSEECDARPFNTALEAMEFCEKQGLAGLEIVLRPDPIDAPPPLRATSFRDWR